MVFKCKMCGGDIEKIENTNTGKCLYCKSVMTLPDLDNEKILNLYNRANSLRLNNEFDKAYGVYETILEIDNEQVEAHWGLLLCKYGVEYVDDPKTKEKVPTCHRTITSSILKDHEFEFIKKKSYGEALKLYEKEAKLINDIQKQILDISSKEEPYDIFICYKETDANNERTHDSVMAEDIYDSLTKSGYKVFFARITLEDKLGKEYEPYIYSALTSAKVMLAIGTSIENYEAIWVKNEWSRYLEFMKKDKSKTLIPVYSKIDAYKLPEEFAMLQAQNMDKVGAMQDLIRGVKKIIDSSKDKKDVDEDVLKKVKAALDEESSIGDNRYEVTEVKEKLPVWYYVLLLGATGLFGFLKLLSVYNYYAINIYSMREKGLYYLSIPLVVIQFIVTLLVLIAMIMKLKSRKTFVKANYLYFVALVLEVLTGILCLKYNCVVYLLWFAAVGITFILYFVNPKWHLDASSKVIVNKEEKDKLQEKNKNIRNNFTQKSSYAIKIKVFIISAIVCIVVYALVGYKLLFMPKDNGRDESVSQIKVITERLNFRNEATSSYSNYSLLGYLYKDEIYTILDTIEYYEYSDCYIWYKIKTRNGTTGYACGADTDNIYVEPLLIEEEKNEKLKLSNARDFTKRQLVVTHYYLNLREEPGVYSDKLGILTQGNIFTILEEKRFENKNWYKITTSEGVTGWVSGTYVNIYEVGGN